jgi:mRNA-degrading endonuclease RelE of RelBE toxin-antitoxin system
MYTVEWSEEAKSDLRRIPAFVRGPVTAAIEQLRSQAASETRNRRRLKEPLEDLPSATWQIRVGDYRGLYRISDGRTVQILRVILKGTDTTWVAVARGKRP